MLRWLTTIVTFFEILLVNLCKSDRGRWVAITLETSGAVFRRWLGAVSRWFLSAMKWQIYTNKPIVCFVTLVAFRDYVFKFKSPFCVMVSIVHALTVWLLHSGSRCPCGDLCTNKMFQQVTFGNVLSQHLYFIGCI